MTHKIWISHIIWSSRQRFHEVTNVSKILKLRNHFFGTFVLLIAVNIFSKFQDLTRYSFEVTTDESLDLSIFAFSRSDESSFATFSIERDGTVPNTCGVTFAFSRTDVSVDLVNIVWPISLLRYHEVTNLNYVFFFNFKHNFLSKQGILAVVQTRHFVKTSDDLFHCKFQVKLFLFVPHAIAEKRFLSRWPLFKIEPEADTKQDKNALQSCMFLSKMVVCFDTMFQITEGPIYIQLFFVYSSCCAPLACP